MTSTLSFAAILPHFISLARMTRTRIRNVLLSHTAEMRTSSSAYLRPFCIFHISENFVERVLLYSIVVPHGRYTFREKTIESSQKAINSLQRTIDSSFSNCF